MFTRSRQHLTQWLMVAMGSVFVAFGGLLYGVEVDRELYQLDRQLYREAQVVVSGGGLPLPTDLRSPAQIEVATGPLLGRSTLTIPSDLVYARWYDSNHQLLMFFGPLAGDRRPLQPGYQTLTLEGQRLRQITVPMVAAGQTLGHLQLAMAVAPVEATLGQLRLWLSLGLPIGVGLMGALGWWFAGQVMGPIQTAYQRLERFSADASHELRSPVASILSQAELGLMTGSPQDQRARLQRIADLAQTMGRLINGLMLLVSGDRWPETQRCNLTALVQQIDQEFAPQAVAQGLHWQAHWPPAAVWVAGEDNLLRQAVTNLLTNACRYTPAGGEVTLALATEAGQATIAVGDTGIGIAETDLPYLCDRFYRVDPARSHQTGGFGLGLAIVQQIIRAHGGTLQIHSVVGQGSTFTLSLPLERTKKEQFVKHKKGLITG